MTAAPGPVLELHGVERRYGGDAVDVRALRGVDLRVEPGELLSIEGPSGCGKTTLLNILGLLDVPTAGEFRWGGVPTARLTERERSQRRLTGVGFIFQRFYLLPTLTALENVELPMRAAGVARTERRARAGALLGQVGLAERTRSYPHQLSGGEEQRVAVARALANRPRVLLADEPTGELDRANTDSILDLLTEVHRTTAATLVLVTHNPRVAERARRHIQMEDGRIVADGGST